MIRNAKTVDPADPSSPEVVQIETAMGAAIEVFDGARTIEVGGTGSCPVKTTNDLLVLRSDCYHLDDRACCTRCPSRCPFVDLGKPYKLVAGLRAALPGRRAEPARGDQPRGPGRLGVRGRRHRRR